MKMYDEGAGERSAIQRGRREKASEEGFRETFDGEEGEHMW
jgi:hypothetical protein